ncbi:hypothetical protein DVA81_19475, partial [Acinetobacter baumannii]
MNDSITSTEDFMVCINKIHDIFTTDSREFEDKVDSFNGESLSPDISHSLTSISQFAREATPGLNLKRLALLG